MAMATGSQISHKYDSLSGSNKVDDSSTGLRDIKQVDLCWYNEYGVSYYKYHVIKCFARVSPPALRLLTFTKKL